MPSILFHEFVGYKIAKKYKKTIANFTLKKNKARLYIISWLTVTKLYVIIKENLMNNWTKKIKEIDSFRVKSSLDKSKCNERDTQKTNF